MVHGGLQLHCGGDWRAAEEEGSDGDEPRRRPDPWMGCIIRTHLQEEDDALAAAANAWPGSLCRHLLQLLLDASKESTVPRSEVEYATNFAARPPRAGRVRSPFLTHRPPQSAHILDRSHGEPPPARPSWLWLPTNKQPGGRQQRRWPSRRWQGRDSVHAEMVIGGASSLKP